MILRIIVLPLFIFLPVNSFSSSIADNDFISRSQHPDVIFAEGFDSARDISEKIFKDSRHSFVVVDSSTKASGAGSLQLKIPSNTGPAMSGTWRSNFSDDESIKLGAGDDLYVQWRQRFSNSMLDSVYSGGGGWKQIILGEGDYKGYHYGNSGEVGSCSSLEIVVQNVSNRAFPQLYHNCGEYIPFETGYKSVYGADYKLQNAIKNKSGRSDKQRFVLYSQEARHTNKVRSDFPGMAYYPNEWMTFQIRLSMGSRGTAIDSLTGKLKSGFINSTVEMWVAREGGTSVKTHSYSGVVLRRENGTADTDEKYGKIWLLAFNTGKDASKSYPVAYTWYDELIISKTRIADPL